MLVWIFVSFLFFLFCLIYFFGWFSFILFFFLSETPFFSLIFYFNIYVKLFFYLVLLVSFFIMFFIMYYMKMEYSFGYYMIMMFVFMMSMFGLLVSSNWVAIILSWEGLGISSFFLISYNQSWESIGNSFCTLMTMRFGDFFLFLYFCSFFYYSYFNVYYFYSLEGLFLIFVCFTKSAQIPFSGWLPKAMSAPTPTSSLVHSSTLVTAGLVLIMNYTDLLMSNKIMMIMFLFGLLTMVLGSLTALSEINLKKLVAYSTLSQMGLGMMVYGLGYFYLGFINLIVHGFAKSLLFMQIGYLIHLYYNQQNSYKWSFSNSEGFLRIQIMCTLFSLCGIVFFSGMLSKEAILESTFGLTWNSILLFFVMVSVYLTFIYSYLIYKFTYVMSNFSVYYNQKSLFMFFVTSLEVFLVIFYFSWLEMNIVNVHFNLGYIEIFFPFVFFIFFIFLFYFIFNLNLFYSKLFMLLSVLNNYQHYVWFKPFVLFVTKSEHLIFSFMYNVASFSFRSSIYTKFYLIGKFNFIVIFFIVLLMVIF